MKRLRFSSPRGQELVEYALILPLLLALLFGIIEFGIAVFTYNTVANVAREVARYAAVNRDVSAVDDFIENDVERWSRGLNPDNITVTWTLSGGQEQFRRTVQVEVTYTHQFVTAPVIAALGGNPNLTMRTAATMYTEYH